MMSRWKSFLYSYRFMFIAGLSYYFFSPNIPGKPEFITNAMPSGLNFYFIPIIVSII